MAGDPQESLLEQDAEESDPEVWKLVPQIIHLNYAQIRHAHHA
jgi:hypothetical protein